MNRNYSGVCNYGHATVSNHDSYVLQPSCRIYSLAMVGDVANLDKMAVADMDDG